MDALLPLDDLAHSASVYVAPFTATECTLARLWSEVLNFEPVGVHDNFFDLGGHSFLAIQVISSLRGLFGVEVALIDFLETPTVHAQARIVDSAILKSASQDSA